MSDSTGTLRITHGSPFGPLPAGFRLVVDPGYSVLVGPNNAGKSAILQLAFRSAMEAVSNAACVFIRPDRLHVSGSTQTGGQNLESYNNNFVAQFPRESPFPYASSGGIVGDVLPALLLNHTNFYSQITRLLQLLEELRLPQMVLRDQQRMTFDDVDAHFHGSGLRALLHVLAALTDDRLQVILVDEPELSLHAELQRDLRAILQRESAKRIVLVATHSPLLLNRDEPERNFVVARDGDGVVTARAAQSHAELLDVTYRMLGNSPEDLFLPANFVVVEGASDQVILQRVLSLLAPDHRVKVLSARGVDRANDVVDAVERALTPLVLADSPYARRIVVVLDKPTPAKSGVVERVRHNVGDRLIVLDAPSMEEYLPSGLYERAGLDKAERLAATAATDDYAGRAALKREISRVIAPLIDLADLNGMPELKNAAELALRQAHSS